MKLGIIISLVLVLFLGLLGFFAYWGVVDPSSNATSPDKLAKMQLPDNLPPLFRPTIPNGDAVRTYDKVLNLYHDHRDAFTSDDPSDQLVDELIGLLVEAMEKGHVRDGFLDDHIPIQPGATPDFHDALESLPVLALMRIDQIYSQGDRDQAILATRAIWALGQRAFENNVRLYNRLQGLTIMLDAGDKLLPWHVEMAAPEAQHISNWMKAVNDIDQVWRAKYELLATLRPRMGDLLQIARQDHDTSFRVAAILKLGLAKFNPGGRGNKRVIDQTIQEARNHSSPLVVQAGIAASGMTIEQMRKLY